MRKVVSESEVAHLWANKIQDEARKADNGNFYFYGDTIYSYGSHFPIAVHYPDKKMGDVVLFTLDSYSSTTSGHISTVSGASSHLKKVYCLNPRDASKGWHHKNVEHWFAVIDRQFEKLRKAHKPSLYLAVIGHQINYLNEYMALFPKVKLNKEQKTVLALIEANKDNIKAAVKIKDEAMTKLAHATIKKNEKAWKKFVPLWHENKEDSMSKDEKEAVRQYNTARYNVAGGATMIRYVPKEKPVINTSLNIDIPVDVAHRFYKKYKSVVKAGGCEGDGCKEWEILGYKVKSATADLLVVGCHHIHKAEIDQLVTKLNW